MKTQIIKLDINDFEKCGNIWDMQRQSDLAKQFYREMRDGNRTTYVYTIDGLFIGEISVVKDADDADYTIPEKRLYVSRLIVKEGYRRQGIGRKLVSFMMEEAKAQGYSELSIGVDLDNYPALKLYIDSGFDKVIFIGEDEYGKFVKLVKTV
ncbi:MAG: GNAT family N-acetyltransferase [Ruminococcus sp.]|nr:GNAT family N-acetyltransferase [Ruminococcus sp.]